MGKARISSNLRNNRTPTSEDAEEPETRTVIWYQIRLRIGGLRADWVGGAQVQLDTPDEIYLEGEAGDSRDGV